MTNCFKTNQFSGVTLEEESIIKTTSARHLPISAGKTVEVSVSYRASSIAQSILHFTLWQICSIENHRSFSGKHSTTRQLISEDHSYTNIHHYQYSYIQLSKLEQCEVKQTCSSFHTTAHDSDPGVLTRKSDTLLLFHGNKGTGYFMIVFRSVQYFAYCVDVRNITSRILTLHA